MCALIDGVALRNACTASVSLDHVVGTLALETGSTPFHPHVTLLGTSTAESEHKFRSDHGALQIIPDSIASLLH